MDAVQFMQPVTGACRHAMSHTYTNRDENCSKTWFFFSAGERPTPSAENVRFGKPTGRKAVVAPNIDYPTTPETRVILADIDDSTRTAWPLPTAVAAHPQVARDADE